MVTVILSLIAALALLLSFMTNPSASVVDMDVKCAVYANSDDENSKNVDVRILVMNLLKNSDYTAEVIPDHNPPVIVKAKSDQEGIFWVVAKVLDGENSLLFNVIIYKGNFTNGVRVASGNDDAPCYRIPLSKSN